MRLLESRVLERALSRIALATSLLLLASRAGAVQRGWEQVDLPGTGSYTLNYVPFSLDLSSPAPAVVFLHGSGLGPDWWQQNSPLVQVAEELGFVLVMPQAAQDLNFGVGDDEAVIDAALAVAESRLSIDTARIGLSGFSAGAAYALVLAYVTPPKYNGVFAMGAPYRTVIRLSNPSAPPPIHFEYGTNDPNFTQLQYLELHRMFDNLGVANELDLVGGLAHQVPPYANFKAGFAFLLGQPRPSCAPGATALCLRGRFRVSAKWQTAQSSGDAGVVQLTNESGYLWFFAPDNVEVGLKVVDACSFNQRYWMFASGTTDVGVELEVTDTLRGVTKHWVHPRGTPYAPVLDTDAFATCP